MPARIASRGEPSRSGTPSSCTSPVAGNIPKRARAISRWPFPWIPPSPTISPEETVNETPSNRPGLVRFVTFSRIEPGFDRFGRKRERQSSAYHTVNQVISVNPALTTVSTTLPSFMIVIRSARLSTSRNRCEMKTTPVLAAREPRRISPNR